MHLTTNNVLAKISHMMVVPISVGYYLSRFRTCNNLFQNGISSTIRYRFTIQKNQVFRFPSECRELRVLSGIAWITVAREDIILTVGNTAILTANKAAIISPLGDSSLILEVL